MLGEEAVAEATVRMATFQLIDSAFAQVDGRSSGNAVASSSDFDDFSCRRAVVNRTVWAAVRSTVATAASTVGRERDASEVGDSQIAVEDCAIDAAGLGSSESAIDAAGAASSAVYRAVAGAISNYASLPRASSSNITATDAAHEIVRSILLSVFALMREELAPRSIISEAISASSLRAASSVQTVERTATAAATVQSMISASIGTESDIARNLAEELVAG
jgi:hypothetical protein